MFILGIEGAGVNRELLIESINAAVWAKSQPDTLLSKQFGYFGHFEVDGLLGGEKVVLSARRPWWKRCRPGPLQRRVSR